MSNDSQSVPCLLSTWHNVEPELLSWLIKKSHNEHSALDILQETFLRALQQAEGFCDIENRRAWLFRVANNLLNDEWRHNSKQQKIASYFENSALDVTPKLDEMVDGDLPFINLFDEDPVDGLVQCLPKALLRLNAEDREILEACDIKGMSQKAFADVSDLTLSATKSRLQRARTKLKKTLNAHCQVRFDDEHKVCCFTPSEKKS